MRESGGVWKRGGSARLVHGRDAGSKQKKEKKKKKTERNSPDLVFLKPSSYIANAHSNMGLIHNG